MVLYRPDRARRPRTLLPLRALRPEDGWCDAPGDRNYNRPVRLPYEAGGEKLWRDDGAYDLLLALDYNFSRRSMGLGSAIFLHLEHDDKRPSAGCVTMAQRDMRWLLANMAPDCHICI
jgi:L,D-peptidoglycan transpeptidase YkuD (ErfK/YbiS/YcfS/YnhG family)